MKNLARKVIRRLFPESLREAVHNLISEIEVAYRTRIAAKRLQKFGKLKGLKIHLGSGPDVKEGWINFDYRYPIPFV